MKPNNTIVLKCTEDSFLRTWMEFLAPFHKLTSRERDVASRLLKQYFRLKASIEDPEVLKDVMWSHTSRKDMMNALGMSPAHFQMTLTKLKKAGVIMNNDINPKFIPHITEDPRHMLCIVFDWSSSVNRIDTVEDKDRSATSET